MNAKITKPLFIAHRGASYDAPENTLASVNLAWMLDADGVEIDIQLTRDNQVVVFHDDNTLRYHGDARLISKCTYDELLKLDVGSFKNVKYKGEKIPLLSEVLNTVPANKILVIELKSGPQIIPHLQTVIEKSQINFNQIIFISFRRDSIKQIKKMLPDCKALRIYALKQIPFTGIIFPSLNRLLQDTVSDELDGMDISFVPAVSQSFITRIRDAGFILYFWTIDDPEKAIFLSQSGVDGITTNRPDWLMKQVASHSK